MKYIVLFLFCCCILHADNTWTNLDTSLEIGSEVGICAEWAQMHNQVVNQKNVTTYNELTGITTHYQQDPVMGIDRLIYGTHPKMKNLNLYFAAILLAHPIVSYTLDCPYRELFQGGTIVFEGFVIPHNASVGCKLSF